MAIRPRSREERTEERRQELVRAVKDAHEIVDEGLEGHPSNEYRTTAYSLILRELLDFE